MAKKTNEIDLYIASFPKKTQLMLNEMRETIKKAAPEAEEVISYKMPAYKYFGMLVYFAGYDHHIGLYPTGSGIKEFEKEIADYKSGKGSVQFPLDQALPIKLITKIIRFRVKENKAKAEAKKAKPKKA